MDARSECHYKEKCYRKKYDHFEKFKHPHLDELLEKIGIHEVHVPYGYIPLVSFTTLKEQLEIERKIRASKISEGSPPEKKKVKVDRGNDMSTAGLFDDGNDGIFPLTSEAIRAATSKVTDGSSQVYASEESQRRKSSQSATNRSPSKIAVPGTSEISAPETSSQAGTSLSQSNDHRSSQGSTNVQTGSAKKSFEKQRVCSTQHSVNMNAAAQFKKIVQSQIHMNIGDKLRRAAPYNILYTTVITNSSSPPDRLAVTFPELIDSPLGLLEGSLLINFMVEFEWLLACYFTMGHSRKPITLLYGETDIDFGTKFDSFLKYVRVKPPSPFGTHHTKMMIFHYLDKSIRIVICTANLVESDWTNKTQGVWISDKCDEMLPEEVGGESRTNFKQDLLAYLRTYQLPVLDQWIERVEKADMSHINVFFVGSVPGKHAVVDGKWGQARLRKLLKTHAPIVDSNNYRVITQISSIGSLGPNPNSWLMGEMLTTFSYTKSSSHLVTRPSLSVIYPSFANVEASADGLLAGGCLPYNSNTHRKQEWLSSYLNHWKSDTINRTKAIPHIKSYTRVSSDRSRISYFLLTSANLSKAAWGTISKQQSLNILSYEAGVLLLPEFLVDANYFPLNEETDLPEEEMKPAFSLPYDVPLTPYGFNDIPWFIDNLPS